LRINERNQASRFNISKGYRNIFDGLKTDGDIAALCNSDFQKQGVGLLLYYLANSR